jgi:hypothetical protein
VFLRLIPKSEERKEKAMTPFWIYLPLAIAAFAGYDKWRGKRIQWVPNIVVILVLYGLGLFFHR